MPSTLPTDPSDGSTVKPGDVVRSDGINPEIEILVIVDGEIVHPFRLPPMAFRVRPAWRGKTIIVMDEDGRTSTLLVK